MAQGQTNEKTAEEKKRYRSELLGKNFASKKERGRAEETYRQDQAKYNAAYNAYQAAVKNAKTPGEKKALTDKLINGGYAIPKDVKANLQKQSLDFGLASDRAKTGPKTTTTTTLQGGSKADQASGKTNLQIAGDQMAKIDPLTSGIRKEVQSNTLAGVKGGQLTAGDLKQLQNAQGYFANEQVKGNDLGLNADAVSGRDAYLKLFKQTQDENALGSQLDEGTRREVEQAARRGQAARGNLNGNASAIEEAMTVGSAGEARKAQRLANAQQTAGQVYQQGLNETLQGYQLGQARNQNAINTSGLVGDKIISNTNNLNNLGLQYLSSGQSPFDASQRYYQSILANNAAYGSNGINPAGVQVVPGANLQGTIQQGANNGLNFTAGQYAQSLNSAQGSGGSGSPWVGALGGAASGALAGAAAGSVIPGVGTVVGGVVGGLVGGAGGYAASK